MPSDRTTTQTFHSGNRTRVPALDSIRAIAVTFVLLQHAWPLIFGTSGFIGVELFFVLSGFLITSILVSDQRAGAMSYGRFYLNRVLRLYPALVTMLVCAAVVVAITNAKGDRPNLTGGLITGLTYTTDIPGWPLRQMGAMAHLWTLSVEEQFYLIWPVLLLAFVKRDKAREFCWIALAASVAAMLLTVAHGAGGPVGLVTIYTWPTTWAVTLITGALYAVSGTRGQASRSAGAAALVGLAALGLGLSLQARYELGGYLLVLPGTAIFGVILVANATSSEPVGFLLHPALRYIGRISYSIYLWNYPLSLWVSGPAAIPLSIVAGALSYHVIERRFLRLRRNAPARATANAHPNYAEHPPRASSTVPI